MNISTRASLLGICALMITFSNFVHANAASDAEQEVRSVESAFAQTMADRDLDAFASFIAEDAVFIGQNALRGKKAIVDAWSAYYTDADAPFSWKPETVVVTGSGDIALSTGPVTNQQGRVFAYYHSTWRKQGNGEWKIILDKGHKYCSPTSTEN
ncbi:YybH family protein [Alteromonas facilis]|uniref:YybH family protein n=1 Tax=Alteromonas facilis TaxID=2048004 RepID=UPI000C28E06A|nr:nuclear transport factor 2 family protein [Alteromonas facilis]